MGNQKLVHKDNQGDLTALGMYHHLSLGMVPDMALKNYATSTAMAGPRP